MKRARSVGVLLAAAVIGIGGGSYLATTVSPSDLGALPGVGKPKAPSSGTPGRGNTSETPTATPSGSANPSGNRPLFYFADERPSGDGRAHGQGAIHDGEQAVDVQLTEAWPVVSLERLGEGWFTAQLKSDGGEEENYYGTVVYADGSIWDLGPIGLAWDVDAEGKVLFSPEPGQWSRADPATRKTEAVEVAEGTGNDLPAMKGDPQWWIQSAESGVLTGWIPAGGKTSQLVLTATKDGENTEVGPNGATRPNVAPDGKNAVASSTDEQAPEDACLVGGVLKQDKDKWWEDCEHKRLSLVSPYSPNSRRLLTVDAQNGPDGLSGFAVLDSGTGRANYQIEAPKGTIDAAWSDDRTLTVLARPGKAESATTIVYRVGIDGTIERAKDVKSGITLGSA